MGTGPLVLASASPRRRVLLADAGIEFVVVPAAVGEEAADRGDPHAIAVANARRKAAAVAGDAVLGADTVVAVGDRLLGKPQDEVQARAFLRALSGTTHCVVTGVALKTPAGLRSRSVETRVTMRTLTDEEIAAYVSSGEAMGKAGAYAIQETADRFVVRVDGPYDNVVGLPVAAVKELMDEAGLR
jgi:septum formation protein